MGGEDSSYEAATDKNLVSENGGWGEGEEPVDADLDGMGDFVGNMETLKGNLGTHSWYVDQVSDMPKDAFGCTGYPDGVAAMKVILANATEFKSYFNMLQQAEMNIAMAGQTCIDAMGGKDNLNGISVNAVEFALDMPGAERPDGIPKQIGKTWDEYYFEELSSQSEAGNESGNFSNWSTSSTSTNNDGSKIVYQKDQYGNRRSIETAADGTTTITDMPEDGPATQTIIETQTTTNPVIQTTETTTTHRTDPFSEDPEDETTTSYESTSTSGNTTTTTQSGEDGKPTSEETVVQHQDGGTTTTDSSYDDEGKQHDQPSVSVGAERPDPGRPPSPVEGLN